MLKSTLFVYIGGPDGGDWMIIQELGRSSKIANGKAWNRLMKAMCRGYAIPTQKDALERIWLVIETLTNIQTGKQMYTRAYRPNRRYSYDAERYNHGIVKHEIENFLSVWIDGYQKPEKKSIPIDRLQGDDPETLAARMLYFVLAKLALSNRWPRYETEAVQRAYNWENIILRDDPIGANFYGAMSRLIENGLAVDDFEPGDGMNYGTPYLTLAPAEYTRLMGLYSRQ